MNGDGQILGGDRKARLIEVSFAQTLRVVADAPSFFWDAQEVHVQFAIAVLVMEHADGVRPGFQSAEDIDDTTLARADFTSGHSGGLVVPGGCRVVQFNNNRPLGT